MNFNTLPDFRRYRLVAEMTVNGQRFYVTELVDAVTYDAYPEIREGVRLKMLDTLGRGIVKQYQPEVRIVE